MCLLSFSLERFRLSNANSPRRGNLQGERGGPLVDQAACVEVGAKVWTSSLSIKFDVYLEGVGNFNCSNEDSKVLPSPWRQCALCTHVKWLDR